MVLTSIEIVVLLIVIFIDFTVGVVVGFIFSELLDWRNK